MSDDDQMREELYAEIRERRGFLLPVHELFGAVDPEILRRYNDLAGYLIFGEEERGLDLKTRFLVLIGITTAVKGDREGIEWSMKKAKDLGATEQEILEAAALAALPAGIPAVEYAALAWKEVQEGKGWVTMDDDA